LSVSPGPERLPGLSPAVELTSVGLSLGGRPILADLDLFLERGRALAIVGPNGSGKTTLLRVVATLLRPTAGGGRVLGANVLTSEVTSVRPSIGLISHAPALIDELTLEENLEHFSRVSGHSFEACLKGLEVVGLERARSRRAGESSFGMRRRAEIAWLLASKPRLLLLDEARTGLDSEAQELIGALVETTLARDGAVIGVSHEASQLTGHFTSTRKLVAGRLAPDR
jgi:heme exporter protein A